MGNRSYTLKGKSFDLISSGQNEELRNTALKLDAVVAQLVRAPACRRAAFLSKGGLKLSGISVKAKSVSVEICEYRGNLIHKNT
jgi:hypothetical protein